MCYDIASMKLKAIKYAKHRGEDPEIIAKLEKELEQWLQDKPSFDVVSGFAHPRLMVFTQEQPYLPQWFQWGLIPSWIKDKPAAIQISNQTLNARKETIFEKPSFKEAATKRRCLIFIDAYYEHHHQGKNTFPFHIAWKDGSPMCLAGLWDEWIDKETGEVIRSVAIVTTTANPTMAKLHNSPKLLEPRMPAILRQAEQEIWLSSEIVSEQDKEKLLQLLQPIPEEELDFYTVQKIKGKLALGNIPEAQKPFEYPNLKVDWLPSPKH